MTRSHFGAVQRLGTDRYRVSVEGPRTSDGKRTRRSKVVRGSREDAEIELARMAMRPAPPGTAWAAYWKMRVEPSFVNLAEKTAHEYRRLWNKELSPRIGGDCVSDMDWSRANGVITDISAPSVQRSAGRLLSKMCNMAVRDGLLDRNPVDRAIEYAPRIRRPKSLVLAEDVPAFLAVIHGIKYEPLLLAELGAGLRPEEARALVWEDVRPFAFKGRTYAAITVDKALTVIGNTPHLKSTKNAPSERTAICGEPFASRLLHLADGKSGPLCPNDGGYTSPATIAHNWKAWCKSHGIDHVTDSEMRSSYATMMGEAMAPDSIVSGNMGHSNGSVKYENYQRVTMRAKCMAADLLADLLSEFE